MIGDIIVVSASANKVITNKISKKYEDISYQLNDED